MRRDELTPFRKTWEAKTLVAIVLGIMVGIAVLVWLATADDAWAADLSSVVAMLLLI